MALDRMLEQQRAGYNTWDLATHYEVVGGFIGQIWRQSPSSKGVDTLYSIQSNQAFSKWVPQPGPMTRQPVEKNVNLSLQRVDLLRFHR